MSKRFIETTIWIQNKWFRKLEPKYKLFWYYLISNCDSVGVWEEDLELASYIIGEEYGCDDVLSAFGKQIRVINDGKKWWLFDFCNFQYGNLKEDHTANRPHQSYIALLKKHRLYIDYKKSTQRLKEQDKDKDKDKEKEKNSYEVEDSLIDCLNEEAHSQFRYSKTSRKPIRARLNDGFSIDDCELVIKHQSKKWLKDSKMIPYLRPSTLFAAANFEGYLSDAGRGTVKKQSTGFSITVRFSDGTPPEDYHIKDATQLAETIERMHLVPIPGEDREYSLDVDEWRNDAD